MSQSSSSAALKRLTRQKFAVENLEALTKDLNSSSDRTLAVVMGALTEDALRVAITRNFQTLSQQDDDRIFDGFGPLSTFSGKILIGYAIGAIDKIQRSDLEKIKDLRNAFAHAVVGLSFSDKEVADVCMQLRIVNVSKLTNQQRTARWRFMLSCIILQWQLAKQFKGVYLGAIPIRDLIADRTGRHDS